MQCEHRTRISLLGVLRFSKMILSRAQCRNTLKNTAPTQPWARHSCAGSGASHIPLVLLIDEIDSLVGDSLISVLRQLRANYDRRPSHFPQSVILCGVRDVRDYQVYSSREGTHVKGGSAFNIKAESLRLGDFSEGEVRQLLAQHTAERGQAFEACAVERIWTLTCGQPWLVNALAYEACFRAATGRGPSLWTPSKKLGKRLF